MLIDSQVLRQHLHDMIDDNWSVFSEMNNDKTTDASNLTYCNGEFAMLTKILELIYDLERSNEDCK